MTLALPQQRGWLECSRCPLHETRTKVVLGTGNTKAKIMFIGEAPGPKEDKAGVPFIGPSGDMLDTFLNTFEINRHDLFIDNVVACWPFVVDNGRRTTRKPTNEEILACKQRIETSIYLVDPIVIVTLGVSSFASLTGSQLNITAAVGEVYETTVRGWYTNVTYPIYAMFHPAYLARQTPVNPKEKKPDEKHPVHKTYKHFQDLVETMALLAEAYHGIDVL